MGKPETRGYRVVTDGNSERYKASEMIANPNSKVFLHHLANTSARSCKSMQRALSNGAYSRDPKSPDDVWLTRIEPTMEST